MNTDRWGGVEQAFPEPDTLTYNEWVRREAALLHPSATAPLSDGRPRCIVCDRPFTPKKPTQRFDCRPCRVWWHTGTGSAARKASAA
jgi:hypothetical protein